MRTKLVLTTLAFGVASIGTFAQVYSVNAVGYINRTVRANSLALLANQLITGGNTVAEVIPAPPEGTILSTYTTAGGFGANTFEFDAWTTPGAVIAPGTGFFVRNPTAADIQITFVGEVPQGAALTTPLVVGFNLVGSQVPQEGLVTTALGYPAAEGDLIYKWNDAPASEAGGQTYSTSTFEFEAWAPSEPSIAVGQGFFARRAAAGSWTRSFSVN